MNEIPLFPPDIMSRNPPSSARRRSVAANVRLVPLQAQASTTASGRIAAASRDTSSTFGNRRSASTRQQQQQQQQHHDRHYREDEHILRKGDGSVEVSWVPTPKSNRSDALAVGEGEDEDEDGLVGRQQRRQKRALKDTRKGVERFGAGMEKGGEDPNMRALSEQERRGRSQRRRGMRSGSKNAFRQMQA
jgi:ribosome biogenesis protein ENP2